MTTAKWSINKKKRRYLNLTPPKRYPLYPLVYLIPQKRKTKWRKKNHSKRGEAKGQTRRAPQEQKGQKS